MLDRELLLKREDQRDWEMREFQEREAKSNRKWRLLEFGVVLIALGLIVLAAFIEKGGQPTININQSPPIIQPSTSGTEGSQPQ